MRPVCWPALCLAALPAFAQDGVVQLPAGVTPLANVGLYRVAWQSYDGPVVDMPPSWLGHFEPASGISYQPGERVLGRDSMLLHSRGAPLRARSGSSIGSLCRTSRRWSFAAESRCGPIWLDRGSPTA